MHEDFLYRTIKINKKNGKYRTIYAPSPSYKSLLRSFIPFLLDIYNRNIIFDCDHAFLPNRNSVTNASQHINNRYVLTLDIENFFDSIQTHRLLEYIPPNILSFMLVDNKVVQGFPTSPYLANLSMIQIDFQIIQALKKIDPSIIYTRYADDLTISFNLNTHHKNIQNIIENILKEFQLNLNSLKTKIQDKQNGRAIITGIGVSFNRVHPTRATLKKLRAASHQNNTSSYNGLLAWSKCRFPLRVNK